MENQWIWGGCLFAKACLFVRCKQLNLASIQTAHPSTFWPFPPQTAPPNSSPHLQVLRQEGVTRVAVHPVLKGNAALNPLHGVAEAHARALVGGYVDCLGGGGGHGGHVELDDLIGEGGCWFVS